MEKPVIQASFRVDNQLLNEVERFRVLEGSALSQTQYVVYLIWLGRKMFYNLSAVGRTYGVGKLEHKFVKKYPKITTQGTTRIRYRTESVWLNELSTIEINKYIFFALKKLEVENGLQENVDD